MVEAKNCYVMSYKVLCLVMPDVLYASHIIRVSLLPPRDQHYCSSRPIMSQLEVNSRYCALCDHQWDWMSRSREFRERLWEPLWEKRNRWTLLRSSHNEPNYAMYVSGWLATAQHKTVHQHKQCQFYLFSRHRIFAPITGLIAQGMVFLVCDYVISCRHKQNTIKLELKLESQVYKEQCDSLRL